MSATAHRERDSLLARPEAALLQWLDVEAHPAGAGLLAEDVAALRRRLVERRPVGAAAEIAA